MRSMPVDCIVVEFYGDRLASLDPTGLPPEMEIVGLIGGPYDGAEFVRPADAPWLDITIPVTALDRSGLATFARYSSAEQPGRAVFAGLIRQRNQSCSECDCEKD